MRPRTGRDIISAICTSRRNGDPDEADPPRHAPPRAGQSPDRQRAVITLPSRRTETPASCTPISSPATNRAPSRTAAGTARPARASARKAGDTLCPVTPWPC